MARAYIMARDAFVEIYAKEEVAVVRPQIVNDVRATVFVEPDLEPPVVRPIQRGEISRSKPLSSGCYRHPAGLSLFSFGRSWAN